jgi:hypothetical protein
MSCVYRLPVRVDGWLSYPSRVKSDRGRVMSYVYRLPVRVDGWISYPPREKSERGRVTSPASSLSVTVPVRVDGWLSYPSRVKSARGRVTSHAMWSCWGQKCSGSSAAARWLTGTGSPACKKIFNYKNLITHKVLHQGQYQPTNIGYLLAIKRTKKGAVEEFMSRHASVLCVHSWKVNYQGHACQSMSQ